MRAPVPSLRSLALMRAGVVTLTPSPSSVSAVAKRRSSRRFRLWPALLLALLAACDGASPTEPETAGSAIPNREAPGGKPDRPVHQVHAGPASAPVRLR